MDHASQLKVSLMPWQVLLLLKSSDRVMHDLCSAFESCSGPPAEGPRMQLALRRHYNLRPEGELRCFVHDHRLIGTNHYVPCCRLPIFAMVCISRLLLPFIMSMSGYWDAGTRRRQALAYSLLTEEHDAAACQRKLEQRYPSLEEQREQYTELVEAFHAEHIASSFPIPDYVMDVYITASGRVRVSY